MIEQYIIAFFLLIHPFVIYAKAIVLDDLAFQYWTGELINIDYFSYYRSFFVIIFASFLLVSIIGTISESISNKHIIHYLILMIFGLLTLSTFFSDYREISILGFFERREGYIVNISYLIMLIYFQIKVKNIKMIKLLTNCLLISSTLLGIIGMTQFFGIDLFNLSFIKDLILPSELNAFRQRIGIENQIGTLYMTFYNSNYVGSYVALIFPISFGLYLTSKKNKWIIVYGLHTCLIFANCIGSRSRAGIVGILSSMVIFLILFQPSIKLERIRMLVIVPYFFILLFMNSFSGGSILTKLSTLSPNVEQSFYEDTVFLEDIVFANDNVKIITKTEILNLKWNDKELKFYNETNTDLQVNKYNEVWSFENNEYKNYTFTLKTEEGINFLILKIKNMQINFYMDDSGIYLVGTHNRIYQSISHAEALGFENRERFGSGRGYIWSRTFPLLKETVWLGKGPDTFSMDFPQDDFVAKLNNFGKTNVLVDKPHNYYLQIAHGTGLFSLLTTLSLFVIYFVESFKIYFCKVTDSNIRVLGKIIVCSVMGYLVSAIFNDSVVYIAPYFWILLGSGFAINRMNKDKGASSTIDERVY